MSNKLLLYSQQKLPLLLIILFLSVAMALFLPAMITLYIFYPLLIILYIVYLAVKGVSKKIIFLNVLLIVIGTIFTFGVPWILSFIYFIHIFPTYVVILITLTIMTLLPLKKYSIVLKIIIFIFLSTLIGLNTNLIFLSNSFLNQDRKVTEVFNKKLTIKNNEFIEIKSNNKNIPISYDKFDFLSFGSNEGCMCGYWELPNLSKGTIIPYILSIKEVPFSWIKPSDKKIIIDYNEAQNLYNLHIKIFQKNELLSSLTIKDSLPFQGKKDANRKGVNNFNYRLEYLLRHNIWNAILYYYFNIGQVDNKIIVSNFLNKSINIIKTDKNWSKFIVETHAILLHNSNIHLCTTNQDDNYKYYPFNTWRLREKDYSIKLSPNPDRFIFNDNNNITYTTISHSNEFVWHHNIFTYKTTKYFFVLKTSLSPFRIILWKFNHQGDYIKEVHINLPKNIILDGRSWHPLSHITVIDNKMSFRIYNIYEYDNKKNECSYNKVEIEI